MKQTIGDFLIRRLAEANVRHIFGVPGDYNLEFMQQLEDAGNPIWIGNCNELNGSYAADGYARLNGLAAMIVTNGVGALSAMNGIAGACCEHVPVICICGSLPLKSIERGTMMHHTLADGSHDNFLRAFAEVTVAQAQLHQGNAAAEIDRLILTAWRRKRPVYLELPSDVSYLEIDVPEAKLELTMPPSDAERIDACAKAILDRLQQAKAAAFLLDMDAERFNIKDAIQELADKLQVPVATMAGSKTAFDATSPLSLGIYQGAPSPMPVRKAIEQSDCLITVGYRLVDSTSANFTATIPASAIHLRDFSADVGPVNFQGVSLKELLTKILASATAATNKYSPASEEVHYSSAPKGGVLVQTEYWAAMQEFVKEGDVILAEDGTSSAGGSSLKLPKGCTFITQAIWGSIGYTFPSLLGTLIADPSRRHVLFIGDGSFQLTAQELSTMLRHDLKPFIFLINNGGYTIERTILGRDAKYNDVADWCYVDLANALCREDRAETYTVRTVEDLKAVLDAPHSKLVFVEAMMDCHDAPVALIRGGHGSADIDYGPRGPQFKPGSQIEVPSGT